MHGSIIRPRQTGRILPTTSMTTSISSSAIISSIPSIEPHVSHLRTDLLHLHRWRRWWESTRWSLRSSRRRRRRRQRRLMMSRRLPGKIRLLAAHHHRPRRRLLLLLRRRRWVAPWSARMCTAAAAAAATTISVGWISRWRSRRRRRRRGRGEARHRFVRWKKMSTSRAARFLSVVSTSQHCSDDGQGDHDGRTGRLGCWMVDRAEYDPEPAFPCPALPLIRKAKRDRRRSFSLALIVWSIPSG